MKRHAAVIGLGFGDEGKGTIVDFLTSRHSPYGPKHFETVVRINGGAQAGHRVVAGDGRQHIFSQFGSGYFNGTLTHLSRHSLVDPLALVSEAEDLDRMHVGRAFDRLTIDRNALLVTPFHSVANKALERQRGDARHGSCGMGIGETMRFFLAHPDEAPRVGDTQDKRVLQRKLYALHDEYATLIPTAEMPPINLLMEVYRDFANWTKIVDETYLPLIMGHSNVIFEGAQGVLLDQDYGFHPYTTWSKTTFANARDLSGDGWDEVERIGVLRAYHTRHGAGPFPSEVEAYGKAVPDVANVQGDWQGNFRVGHFDGPLARYASDVLRHLGTPLDSVAATNFDRIPSGMRAVDAYSVPNAFGWNDVQYLAVPKDRAAQERTTSFVAGAETVSHVFGVNEELPDFIATSVGAPISITSRGPKAEDKKIPVRV